jgi:hypothetical protein
MIMRMTRSTKIGLTIIGAGLLPIIVFSIWSTTLNVVPIEKPISLSVGHVRQSFTLNFTARYTMNIEVERKLPYETLRCLLGVHDYSPEGQCRNIPAVLRFEWTLAQDGKIVQAGSSASDIGGYTTTTTVGNHFASFEGKQGHYTLDMDILQDGSALSVANPKLRIGVVESVYEMLFVNELIYFVWAFLGCAIGGSTLLFSLLQSRKRKRTAVVEGAS